MVLTFVKQPTSPLRDDRLIVPSEDVLYPGSEEDEAEEKREKQRVRVELLGTQYLEGRPLFIQTASLKGPFEKGWVNPWASRKRARGLHDIRHYSELPLTIDETVLSSQDANTAKRSLGKGTASQESNYTVEDLDLEPQDRRTAKRQKHTGVEGTNGIQKYQQPGPRFGNFEVDPHIWLRTNRSLGSVFKDPRKSPSPTPLYGHQLHSHPHEQNFSRNALQASHQQPRNQGETYADRNHQRRSRSTEEGSHEKRSKKPAEVPSKFVSPGQQKSESRVKIRTFSGSDEATRKGQNEVKRLSQEAVERAKTEDGHQQVKKVSSEPVSTSYTNPTTPGRLPPYVSEVLASEERASSAGPRAATKNPTLSPHVVIPLRESSRPASQTKDPFIAVGKISPRKSRSKSSSSSDSSAFAELLEVAQAKAASGASSYSSSPVVQNSKKPTIKGNNQAIRRLTFTSSGRPKVDQGRKASLRTSSNSSAGLQSISPAQVKISKPTSKGKAAPLNNTSNKSSKISSRNGKSTHSSAVLPEAQIIPGARDQPIHIPSGPSTNLLETDKQSPKAVSLDEGDSFINLSTQAAALKAQHSFKDEVLLGLTPSPRVTRSGQKKATKGAKDGTEKTPLTNGSTRRTNRRRRIAKPEDSDDEEPMSTQAMVDAMSPFAITTIKKRPPSPPNRTTPAPTPNKQSPPVPPHPIALSSSLTGALFRDPSLSMSTSVSASLLKPSPPPNASPEMPPPTQHSLPSTKSPSSKTSFSILPNGTMTETTSVLQDGQKRPQHQHQDSVSDTNSFPLDPLLATPTPFARTTTTIRNPAQPPLSIIDLNDAIEEAGSFLGEWDVEVEAKREGVGSARGKKSGGGESGKGGLTGNLATGRGRRV
ncbi:hypothetical protein MMC21_005880 [Puttea exsequens]|nr:hypothetical protein [Puttea exsequens]